MAPSDMLDPSTLRSGASGGRLGRSRAEVGRAFGFLVHDVSRLIKRRFERRARQMRLPITRQQAAVMLNIAGNEGVSQAEVAASLDIEPIALVRMLDKLHEEGLVERRAHPTDRRIRTLWLTKGGSSRGGAHPCHKRGDSRGGVRRSALPPTRDVLIDVLSHIKRNLALKEEVACDRSSDGSLASVASASGD